MQFLKANTGVDVRIGPFVDVGDGYTPETGVTLSGADEAELLKHNGAATVDISAATWAAVTGCDGWYDLTLTTSHTDTEGQLTVVVQDDSVCLPVFAHFMVLAEAAYDSMFTAKDTGYMDVNVKAVSEDTAAADNLESACDNYSVTRGLTGTALPAAAADAAGGLPISDAGGLDMDAILADTNELQGDWVNGGRLDLILDELTTQGDTNETKIDTIDSNVDAVLVDTGTTLDNHLTDIKGTGFVKDTHSLVDIEGYADLIDDGTSGLAKIATDVAAILVDTAEIGTAGAGLTDLGGMSTGMKAEVEAECTDAIEADGLDHLVSASVTGTDVADNSIIAKMVGDDATADWDSFDNTTDSLEALRNHIGDGTNLTEAGGTGDQLTALATQAKQDTIDTVVDGIQADLDNATDGLGALKALIDALNDVSTSDINTEVLDVLNTDTFAEPGQGAPAATTTLVEKLGYLYKWARNKKDNDGSTTQFYADDTTTVDQKQSTSESGGTVTKGEIASGP